MVFNVQESLLIFSIVFFGICEHSITTVAVLTLSKCNFLAYFLVLEVVLEFGFADGCGAVELGSGLP